MTPLRGHLLTDMQAQNLPPQLQDRYVAEVAALAKQVRKSPDLVADDELAEFLEKRRKGLPEQEAALVLDAIRFFYTQTLGRTWRDVVPGTKTSQLRQRFIQDMRLRNLAPKTQQEYLRWTLKFSQHYGKSPADLQPEDIRNWLVHLVEVENKSISTYGVAAAALRFLYAQTGVWGATEQKTDISPSPEERGRWLHANRSSISWDFFQAGLARVNRGRRNRKYA